MPSDPPIPTRMSKVETHAFAEAAAAHLGFKYSDAIEPLVVRLGGRIEFKSAAATTDRLPESIVVRSARDFTIYLPSVTSVVRDRFTVAHELGHLFLHYPNVHKRNPGNVMIATRWVDKTNEELIRAEWEANWFAAAFLMPSTDFRSIYLKYLRSPEMTALEFGVSTKAAEVRAQTLGLM